MLLALKVRAWAITRVLVSLLPWLAALFLFYWLETSGTWTSETPHRGKMSVALLATGMSLSFWTYSVLLRRRRD